MSSEPTLHGVRVHGRVRSVSVSATTPQDAAAAAERARRDEAEALRAEIREQALETARRDMSERLDAALRELAAERERLRARGDEWLARLEPHVIELSLAIARTLVAQDIEEGRARIRPVVETVLRELREPGASPVVELALSPEDYAALANGNGLSEMEGVRLAADASVPHGACRVTTDAGRIWSDLDARVRSVRRALRERSEVPS